MPIGYDCTFSQTLPVGSSEDELVIDCYRLANWYKQSPEVFLTIPLSTIRTHIERTAQLQGIMERERRIAEEPD